MSPADFAGVQRAARDLASDLGHVSGGAPAVTVDSAIPARARAVIVAGTLGHNAFIDRLVRENKLDVARVAGRWETFLIQVVERADGRASTARWSSPAATSAARSTASTTSRRRSASRRGTGGPTCPSRIRRAVRHVAGAHTRGRAGGEIPRHLPQRRSAGAHRLGEREVRRLQPQVLREGVRADPAAEGQLSVAGDVGQRVRRRRSARTRSSPTNTASSWARRTTSR